MGLAIRCKKSNDNIDVSYFGFSRLRNTVSLLVGGNWGVHYLRLTDYLPSLENTRDKEFYEEFDRETERLINERKINIKVADFLLQSDCEGSIHYGACKEILKVIGDYDDNLIYGYAGRKNPAMFKDFKRVLQACVDKKCDMVWR